MIQDCRLPALKPLKPLKPFRKPFQGNSRSFPQAFQENSRSYRLQQCFKPFRKPFQGNFRSYTPQPSAFKRFKTAVCPPSNPSNPSAGLSKATLAASRRPFQGNSRSYTPQPSVFKRFKTAVYPPSNPSNPSAGLSKASLAASRKPFQGNSRSYTPQTMLQTLPHAFPRQLSQLQAPSHLFLRAFKTAVCPTSNPSNPSAGLSKASLAASRKPFQGNSRSYTPQTMLQTLPHAFPRQLSQLQAPSHLFLRAFKTAVCPTSNSQTLPQAFPRQLLQLPASLSKATLAATGPRQCFKPFRRPFQGNSRSYTPQPSVSKGVQDCRLAAFKPFKPFRRPFQGNSRSFPQAFPRQLSQLHAPDNASNPSAGLSKATLAATRPSHLFLRDSRLPFARPQTPQTLPQAFPRQLLQLPAGLSKATLAATRPRQCFKPK